MRKPNAQYHVCDKNELDDMDEIYKDEDDWILSLDCGCCKTTIEFCPYCGEKLAS